MDNSSDLPAKYSKEYPMNISYIQSCCRDNLGYYRIQVDIIRIGYSWIFMDICGIQDIPISRGYPAGYNGYDLDVSRIPIFIGIRMDITVIQWIYHGYFLDTNN